MSSYEKHNFLYRYYTIYLLKKKYLFEKYAKKNVNFFVSNQKMRSLFR